MQNTIKCGRVGGERKVNTDCITVSPAVATGALVHQLCPEQ